MSKKNEKKFNINIPEGMSKVEVVVREGDAPKALDPKEPEKISISGVLNSPLKWLEKRVAAMNGEVLKINQHRSNIIVNREKMTITQ